MPPYLLVHYPIAQLIRYMPSHVERRHMVNALGGSEVAIGQQEIEIIVDHKSISTSQFMESEQIQPTAKVQGPETLCLSMIMEFSARQAGHWQVPAVIKSTASGRAGWLY
jgi:hypothetical protein